MKKTVKNANLKVVALEKAQLAKIKGGTSSFIIDDDISGIKPVAPSTPTFIIDDNIMGI